MRYILVILYLFLSSCSSENNNSEVVVNASVEENDSIYTIEIDSYSEYYGYTILKNNKPYIKQDYIPAVSGNKKFNTDKDAKKVAALVVKKLQENIFPPTISKRELDSLRIIYE